MKTIESLAKHVNDTVDTITKGEKAFCTVFFGTRGIPRCEHVERVVYTYAESDCVETPYIQWHGLWLELEADNIAYL